MNRPFNQLFVNLVLALSWLTTVIKYRKRRAQPKLVRNILVFQLTELGDVVLATDALVRLRAFYPEAKITLVCGPWARPMMEGQDFIDEVFTYQSNLSATAKDSPMGLRKHWELVRQMGALPTDLIVDLRGNFGSVLVAWLSAARYRVDRGSVRSKDWVQGRSDWDRHETQLNLEIVRPLGIEDAIPRLQLRTFQEADVSLRARLEETEFDPNSPYVVVHPGASWIGKRWREERFAALADQICEQGGRQVILTGSPAEKSIGEAMISAMKHLPINLIGRLDLRELMSLYRRSELWVGNDTGTMHIAVALGRPVVVLWGPTNASKFGPCGTKARLITGRGQPEAGAGVQGWMDLIEVPEVWRIVQQELEGKNHYVTV